jgi:UTP--glucose-1-phosphate uridylyltransferase
MVTARSKTNIEDHFDRNIELEDVLAAKGDTTGLQRVRESAEIASMHYVRQSQPLGLGHAVLCAADHVGDEPFAVLLGDDIIDSRDKLLQRMLEVRHQYGGSVIALMEVAPEQVSAYGVATIKPTDEADVVSVTDLVEKPTVADAPSNWIIVGRYVCDQAIFDVLRKTRPGRGGEIQLTDALRTLAERGPDTDGGGVRGVLFRGRRYDTGNKLDYLQTQIKFACERPDLKDEFVPWLRGYLDELGRRPEGTPAAFGEQHGQAGA